MRIDPRKEVFSDILSNILGGGGEELNSGHFTYKRVQRLLLKGSKKEKDNFLELFISQLHIGSQGFMFQPTAHSSNRKLLVLPNLTDLGQGGRVSSPFQTSAITNSNFRRLKNSLLKPGNYTQFQKHWNVLWASKSPLLVSTDNKWMWGTYDFSLIFSLLIFSMMKMWSLWHSILAKMDVLQSFVLFCIFFDAKYHQSYWTLQEVTCSQHLGKSNFSSVPIQEFLSTSGTQSSKLWRSTGQH